MLTDGDAESDAHATIDGHHGMRIEAGVGAHSELPRGANVTLVSLAAIRENAQRLLTGSIERSILLSLAQIAATDPDAKTGEWLGPRIRRSSRKTISEAEGD